MLKSELLNILAQKDLDSLWLEALTLRQETDALYVGFPHSYYADWFHIHKKRLFENLLTSFFGKNHCPRIIYEKCGFPRPASRKPKFSRKITKKSHSPEAQDFFASFIVNKKNTFPLAAAKKISRQEDGEMTTPFLLCGRSGTGKSHLLHSMASTMTQNERNVLHMKAAEFCDRGYFSSEMSDSFWQQYDAVLLDDLQDLAENPVWQRLLAACIDTCPKDGKHKMVFSCHGSVQGLALFHERLRSRLEGGLVFELLEPDLEVRMRYLQQLNSTNSLNLSREQLLYLAQHCSQFRLLQGLIRKVSAFCAITSGNLSSADLENIVRTSVIDKSPGCLEILGHVAQCFNVSPEEVLGNKRTPTLVRARQLAMYICRQKLGLSYPELGKAFGGKDHSTVIYAIKKIEKLQITDKSVKDFLLSFEQR